jgi:hypothetical protein
MDAFSNKAHPENVSKMYLDPGHFPDNLVTGCLKFFRKWLMHKFNTFSEAGSLPWTGFF